MLLLVKRATPKDNDDLVKLISDNPEQKDINITTKYGTQAASGSLHRQSSIIFLLPLSNKQTMRTLICVLCIKSIAIRN